MPSSRYPTLRTLQDDKSGDLLQQFALADGHTVAERDLVRDDIYAIRAAVSNWIADTAINVVITTGGTGFTGRDSTPEALMPLFDKQIEGFGKSSGSFLTRKSAPQPSNLARSED
ncbi:MAG: hypothetical protein CM15mP120_27800 [Pseudomonadota bacterium]|nr:MAG: hypothetical protein CM15mP120_27800 [Pseudomonadota bacterium]